jgi:hypothetical protein
VFTITSTHTESSGTNLDTITDFTTGSDTISITITAAQMDAGTDRTGTSAFAATDLGDVATFAEVEPILSGTIGETVYVTDTNQLVIDMNGDANINASDIRINMTGTTGYDNADIVWTATADNDTAHTYTLGDGADTFTGGAAIDV